MEIFEPACPAGAGDAASVVLSRFPHPDTAAASHDAFVDAPTGRTLSFMALRQAALSLASGLRFGLGLRRGDAVLVLSPNSLLLPPIVLGVLAAGGVVVTADPNAAAAEIAAVAHSSGAVIIVTTPEVAEKVASVGVPLLLTSRSMQPRELCAEELIDGGDPTALAAPEVAVERPRPSDVALVIYSSPSETVVMTHADLVAAVAGASLPDEGRVCLASLPMCSVHGLPLLALGLPAAGVTTVLMSLPSDPKAARDAVAAHGATDVVATPEVIAALAAPMALHGKLPMLRRVTVAPALAAEVRRAFHRRLPWVDLTEISGMPEKGMEPASEQVRVAPAELGTLVLTQPHAASAAATIQQNGATEYQVSVTNEAAAPVLPLNKIQKNVLRDIFSKSTTSKILRKHPVAYNKQAVSKL